MAIFKKMPIGISTTIEALPIYVTLSNAMVIEATLCIVLNKNCAVKRHVNLFEITRLQGDDRTDISQRKLIGFFFAFYFYISDFFFINFHI